MALNERWSNVWIPTLVGAFMKRYEGVLNSTWAYAVCKKLDKVNEVIRIADIDSAGSVQPLGNGYVNAQPKTYAITQTNIPYGIKLPISTVDYNNDSIGLWDAKAAEMGAKMADHPNVLTIAQLKGNPNCLDGTPYFGAAHPTTPGNTQTNDLSVTQLASLAVAAAAAPIAEEAANFLIDVVWWFYSLIDSAGDPLNGGAKEFLILSSNPKIIASCNTAINAMVLAAGVTNPLYAGLEAKGWKFLADYDPRLGASTSTIFYVFRVDSDIKPFMWGEQFAPKFQFAGPDSQGDIDRDEYVMKVKATRSVGVGRYQHAIRCTLSTAA